MAKNNFVWIIVIIIALFAFGGSASFQSLIGSPQAEYVFDWDEKAPEQAHLLIGSDEVAISRVGFNCAMEEIYNAPKPKASCWTTSVTFQKENTPLTYGVVKPISDYLSIDWTTNSKVHEPRGDDEAFWLQEKLSYYKVSVHNQEFLEATIVSDNNILELGTEKKLLISIDQKLANNIPGGLVIITSNRKANNVPSVEIVPMTFAKGKQIYELEVDTSILGGWDVGVRPFVNILGTEFHDDKVARRAYNILPNIADVDNSVDCTNNACPNDFVCENMISQGQQYNICVRGTRPSDSLYENTSKFSFNVLIIVLFLLIVWVVHNAKKRK